jgi:hypothetical protein
MIIQQVTPATTTVALSNGGAFGTSGNYNWSVSPSTGVTIVPAGGSPSGTTATATFAGNAVPGVYTFTVARTGGTSRTVNVVVGNIAGVRTTANLENAFVVGFRTNPGTGALQNGPTNIFDAFPGSNAISAGLGLHPNGNYYYLNYNNAGTQNGVVQVLAARANGANPATSVGSFDLNGASNDELGFVRLAFDPLGRGWILAGSGTTLYLARFTISATNNGLDAATFTLEDGDVALTGPGTNTPATFANGDIAFTSAGTLYALANNGSGTTYIYSGAPNGASTVLARVWTVLEGVNEFDGQVNGIAFDIAGNLYVSSFDGGLYFLDQTTVNNVFVGSVSCTNIWSGTGLTDLATNFFPSQTTLPVKLGTFTVSKQGSNAVLDWTTATESNSDYFEIQRSTDGVNFVTVGTKEAAGNSSEQRSYQYSDPINTTATVLYYRLNTVDIDHKASYSKIVSLKVSGGNIKNLTVFPNPFTTDLKLQVVSDKDADMTIRINNALGQPVINRRVTLQKGENIIVLSSELQTLKPGIHLMEIITDEGKTTQKIIKR